MSGKVFAEEIEISVIKDDAENNGKYINKSGMYEKAIDSCGFGTFQIILVLTTGCALASDSVEVQVVSFVLPSACDLHMTSIQGGWLNAIIFVGMMIGGYIFGSAADIKGRRYILLRSLSINGVFGLISAFSPTFYWFLLFRFLSGVGVGGAMPILFSYFIEFMPTVRRGPMISLLASFWMIGSIITSALAWLIIPHVKIGGHINTLMFGSWRIFVALCALPSLSSALFMLFMPESPMFLYKVSKYEEARHVFMMIFRINAGKRVPIPKEINEFSILYDKQNETSRSGDIGFSTFIHKVLTSTKKLFLGPLLLPTVILLVIWFTFSFGYYGLYMWFPELFKRMEDGTRSTCTGGTRVHHVFSNITANFTCIQKVAQETRIYKESFIASASNIPGSILAILLINRIGRIRLLTASMVASGMSVFFFLLVANRAHMITMSCIFSTVSYPGWIALDALILENYPANLRSTAFGVQSVVGRISAVTGNIAFGAMIDLHCAVPLLLVASFLSIGGLLALKLPKTDTSPLT